jgi:hypothetical protein
MREYRKTHSRKAENHTPAARARKRKWYKAHPETAKQCVRRADIWRKFGISSEEYDARKQAQGNICGICKTPMGGKYLSGRDVVLDHDHKTGKIREFVHRMCNTAIGQLGDDPRRLRLAAEYLEKYKETE